MNLWFEIFYIFSLIYMLHLYSLMYKYEFVIINTVLFVPYTTWDKSTVPSLLFRYFFLNVFHKFLIKNIVLFFLFFLVFQPWFNLIETEMTLCLQIKIWHEVKIGLMKGNIFYVKNISLSLYFMIQFSPYFF